MKGTGIALGLALGLFFTAASLINPTITGAFTYTDGGYISTGQIGVADSGCLGCHDGITASDQRSFLKTGHNNALRQTAGLTPVDVTPTGFDELLDLRLALLATPEWTAILTATPRFPVADHGSPERLAWSDIHYVIGGFGWKTAFGMEEGWIWTGTETRYDLGTDSWGDYEPGQDEDFYCGRCHGTNSTINTDPLQGDTLADRSEPWQTLAVTGDVTDGGHPAHSGFTSAWTFDGIQCENCHGPFVPDHDINPGTYPPLDNGLTQGNCSNCHQRTADDTHGADTQADHYIKNHAQYNELVGNTLEPGVHQSLDCVDCHNPHLRVHRVTEQVATALGITDNTIPAQQRGAVVSCETCHAEITDAQNSLASMMMTRGNVQCIDCHMARASKSAASEEGAWGRNADVRTHIFKINPAYGVEDTTGDPLTGLNSVTGTAVAHNYITLNYACGSCHDASMSTYVGVSLTDLDLARMAQNIHQISDADTVLQYARFNWYKGGGCNAIEVDGSMNNATTYSWDWGDGSLPDSGATASHAYNAPGVFSVTLTTDVGVRTILIPVTGNNLTPTTSSTVSTDSTLTGDAVGMSAILTDTSTLNSCSPTGGFGTVLWGDGTVTTGLSLGGVVTHRYSTRGTFMIQYSFRDAMNNRKSMANAAMIVVPDVATAIFQVNGTITKANGEPLKGAKVYLKAGNSIFKFGGTNASGQYTFYNVMTRPANAPYSIEPEKIGYSFTPPTRPATNGDSSAKNFTATVAW